MSTAEGQAQMASGALQALTEQVLFNVKLSTPALDDLLKQATKYQTYLEQASVAAGHFMEAMAKAATTAARSRGATAELGQSLTQIVSKHHALVLEQQIQARKLTDQFIAPLTKRLKSDSKTFPKIEDDFSRSNKTFKSEFKKLGQTTVKAQKTAEKKGDTERLEASLREMQLKSKQYEAFHQRCLRTVLIEERRRYCYLVDNYASVFQTDFHTQQDQELLQQTVALSHHPEKLPASSEKLIEDNSSNGLMFDAPGPGTAKLQPSQLTREFQASMRPQGSPNVPPGAPPGGLASVFTTADQINPGRRTGVSPSPRYQ